MVFISGEGGGAGSRLTQDVGNILAQLPETVEALTGGNTASFPLSPIAYRLSGLVLTRFLVVLFK